MCASYFIGFWKVEQEIPATALFFIINLDWISED